MNRLFGGSTQDILKCPFKYLSDSFSYLVLAWVREWVRACVRVVSPLKSIVGFISDQTDIRGVEIPRAEEITKTQRFSAQATTTPRNETA